MNEFRYALYKQQWSNHNTMQILMFEGNSIVPVASVCVSNWPSTSESYIHSLYVTPRLRRKGISKTLLRTADSGADYKDHLIAEVEPDAPSWLREYYKSRGYEVRLI